MALHCRTLLAFFAFFAMTGMARAEINYHWIGWANTLIPGSGQALLGSPLTGAEQAAAEIGTFAWGYSLSPRTPMSLDGVPANLPSFQREKRYDLQSLNAPLYANILQEFGIKYHMVNTFEAYRSAAAQQGFTEGIDQTSTLDLFKAPFDSENLKDPWVWIPISVITAATLTDYYLSRNSVPRGQALTPYSNFLFAFHYAIWEPAGSGVPEEMFYRGFLQNEFNHLVSSPYFSIPLSALAFGLSHRSGDGQVYASLVGLYLGYLAHRENGQLKKGITVHFWGGVIMGIESILLSHDSQRSTPPTALSVQVNF